MKSRRIAAATAATVARQTSVPLNGTPAMDRRQRRLHTACRYAMRRWVQMWRMPATGAQTDASSASIMHAPRGGGGVPATAAYTLPSHCSADATAGQSSMACHKVSRQSSGTQAAWEQHAASGGSTCTWHRNAPTYKLPCKMLDLTYIADSEPARLIHALRRRMTEQSWMNEATLF